MKVLIFWDIYGRIWRKAFLKEFSSLVDAYAPDFIVVNVDNISSGRGIIMEHARLLIEKWVDVLTGWDHIFDNFSDIEEYMNSEKCRLLRPANFPHSIPWKGYTIVEKDGKKLGVIHLLGNIFMNHQWENPFLVADRILEELQREKVQAVVMDFHREASSELYGMAFYLDGRISAVFWTHTHIQTNDAHILPWGTALITDIGMNGPHHSVIWADFSSVKKRFLTGIQKWKIQQSLSNEYVISALSLEIDEFTGKTLSCIPIRFLWIL